MTLINATYITLWTHGEWLATDCQVDVDTGDILGVELEDADVEGQVEEGFVRLEDDSEWEPEFSSMRLGPDFIKYMRVARRLEMASSTLGHAIPSGKAPSL